MKQINPLHKIIIDQQKINFEKFEKKHIYLQRINFMKILKFF